MRLCLYIRRVYGVKVTRITRGDLPSSTRLKPGQGNLVTEYLHGRQKSAEALRAGLTTWQRAEHVVSNRSLEFRWREQRQKPRKRSRGPGWRVGAGSPESMTTVHQASR